MVKKGWAYSRRADAAGIAATAAIVAVCAQLVLMLFDPHLTYRGSGDAFFMLIALVRILPGRQTGPAPTDLSRRRLQLSAQMSAHDQSTVIASRWGSHDFVA